MSTDTLLSGWDQTHSLLWGHRPVRLSHTLHMSPLFAKEELARLIERYPREHYSLVHSGGHESRRVWREGEIGALTGAQVMDAIAAGRFWLNLRDAGRIDARYDAVLSKLCDEIGAMTPLFRAPTRQAGILISSPETQVYYHADLPGQLLIQLAGRKRVYVYPATPPFVTPEHLEDIAVFDVEVDMPSAPWYDGHATIFDFEPGQMLSWPLNAPHRVENVEGVNVSMTVSYANTEIRRAQAVSRANGLLRHRFGRKARSRAISGPAFWMKAVMQEVLLHGRWIKRERLVRRPIDFRLDPRHPGQIVDLAPGP